MPIQDALDSLRFDRAFMANVTAWERIPARPARYADFPPGLDPRLIAALRSRGTAPLFTHQAAAVEASLAGENVVVVTGTASGKTLCYNLPVLQSLLSDPAARALYLFPTKALAQDQAAALGDLIQTLEAGDLVAVRTYDGDTPKAQRRGIRDDARLLITNPDMLHTGILPHHPRWAAFFENLRWVVLDELHVYRGVFGSNVANLLRRLRRLCRFYDADPRFILTSATIANPKELAERLIEAPVHLVPPDLDGSPRAEKHVLIYNPPVIDPALGIRRAYTLESARLAGKFLGHEVRPEETGKRFEATAAATCRWSGGRSSAACAMAPCGALWRRTPSNWVSTSASLVRRSSPATRARSPASGNRPAGPAAGRRPRPQSSSPPPPPSTSLSPSTLVISSSALPSMA
jgi:DEAD/DEAH box helicase domain-containing protein